MGARHFGSGTGALFAVGGERAGGPVMYVLGCVVGNVRACVGGCRHCDWACASSGLSGIRDGAEQSSSFLFPSSSVDWDKAKITEREKNWTSRLYLESLTIQTTARTLPLQNEFRQSIDCPNPFLDSR